MACISVYKRSGAGRDRIFERSRKLLFFCVCFFGILVLRRPATIRVLGRLAKLHLINHEGAVSETWLARNRSQK